ncbi:hypothetical protein [Bacillus benzoevorans]|uniref:Uncharacterized protein n=1 Tax=Bacillus benzoevorans TaxID=1456 RepID=A0A7X0HUE1_9BACI|nr:hypothetical protein [Bacillus benzoevorans]MBB6447039.1 hypothetical protein [Bacillus benzoevorans]
MISKEDVAHMANVNAEWASVLNLFQNHSKLQNYLTAKYFDLNHGFIHVKQLLKVSKPWSKSEQFMLRLAIHLFNGEVKVDLNDIDYLDLTNKQLVMEALKIRFKGM